MMEPYFKQMNEAYIDKHYPKKSVFSAVSAGNKKAGAGVYIFFGILLVFFGAAGIFTLAMTAKLAADGDSDTASIGIIIGLVCLAVCALSIWMIVLTKKRSGLDAGQLIKKSAGTSMMGESEIREFESQAMASDSYILSLTGKVNAVMAGQKDGILTRDYIYLADPSMAVMKCRDILSAVLVERIIFINVNKRRKPVHYLCIQLVSKQGVRSQAETDLEPGKALIGMLLEKNPGIDTAGGAVIQEKEYEAYIKKLLGK